MFKRCSRAVRALFKRCSRGVRTLFALAVRTFNFQIRVACCVRVRTRCLHAVRTLFVRCSCAVRALFVRCLCERELTRELRDAPVCKGGRGPTLSGRILAGSLLPEPKTSLKCSLGALVSGNKLTFSVLAGRKSVADLKTLSPCDPYSNDRTGNPSAVVNARQKNRRNSPPRSRSAENNFRAEPLR